MGIDRLSRAVLPERRKLPCVYRSRVREDFFHGREDREQGPEREVEYRRLFSAVTLMNPLQELFAGDLFRAAQFNNLVGKQILRQDRSQTSDDLFERDWLHPRLPIARQGHEWAARQC